jgi:hypothetical protein
VKVIKLFKRETIHHAFFWGIISPDMCLKWQDRFYSRLLQKEREAKLKWRVTDF